MSFLDNSGDIILDAVLTDLGRLRISQGRFNIYQYAFGDEEINYQLYNPSHPDGTQHYDVDILKTPVLEAFTNNESLMKSRLVTFSRTDLLYMPILKINNKVEEVAPSTINNGFILLADRETIKANSTSKERAESGFIPGVLKMEDKGRFKTKAINIDQGIDSTEDGRTVMNSMDKALLETAFIVKVDHRLLRLQIAL